MVADMQHRMNDSVLSSHFDETKRWSIIVKEIDFHGEIIKYERRLLPPFTAEFPVQGLPAR